MKPVSVRYRPSRFPSPPLSTDLYYTPSGMDTSLRTNIRYKKEDKENILRSDLPNTVNQHKKQHDETIQRYDRLLEKMRATDEQLQSLSRSRLNNEQQRTSVSNNSLFYQQIFRNYKNNFSMVNFRLKQYENRIYH
jgi:hypothetical protein